MRGNCKNGLFWFILRGVIWRFLQLSERCTGKLGALIKWSGDRKREGSAISGAILGEETVKEYLERMKPGPDPYRIIQIPNFESEEGENPVIA